MMTVSVGLTSCTPQAKDLEKVKKASQGDEIDKEEGENLKTDQVKYDAQRTDDLHVTSSSKIAEDSENGSSEAVSSSGVSSEPSKQKAVLANEGDTPEVGNTFVSITKTTKQGRAVSRGRRKSDNKEYNQKSQSGGRNRGRKISKSNRDYENSSSNGGNSGADGNGEDNGSDDDDEDDDADEDDEDDDDDDDDDGEDDDDDEDEEESKNEDDDDDISVNGNEKNGKDTKIKQEPSDDQEMFPSALQGFMTGLDGNIPLADLLEKLPNSVCPGDEKSSAPAAPAAPGVPVTLHGIVCHETGGVLVVNIKWRNKFYCGSLMDCSRHAWASPRFPAMDGGESEMKMGGKGGKGKRRQKNSSVSSSPGNLNKEATPLKHKLRGRKRGVSGCPPPKSQGFKGMGKRRSKNMDDDDDGPRPGKRSCTMKTTVSPQPSPTLIECPEPGCDKKYKHINGLRYHQAHAHLEESNQSDERSASTSPSPVEEFKEPDTKSGFKGRTSRVSARARSVSPSLAAALAAIERKNDATKGSGSKKKEISELSSDLTNAKEPKVSKSPVPTNEEDSAVEDASVSYVESSDKCQQACEHEIRKENDNQKNVDMAKREIDSKTGFKPVLDEQQTAVKNLEKEQVMLSKGSTNLPTCTTATGTLLGETPDTGKIGIKSEAPQSSQEVWETVIDSGFSGANDSGKSHNMDERISISQVEDMEKALGESSLSGKQSDKQLSIPGMQPVDLRQAVDTGVGLINQLGIEVEDISENEEDIDPGQDSEYTSKDMTSLSCSTALTGHTNSSGISKLKGLPFAANESYITQMQKSGVSSEALRTKPGSSLHFDKKINKEQDGRALSKCESSKNSDLWTNSSENFSGQSSAPAQRSTETKPTTLEDKAVKTTSGGISMEALVSKSISRSAVEPPLINSDAPSMRYKFFECRNYGDDNYDKCIRTSEVDQKGNIDSKATLAPIRYPELVRNGANSEPLQTHRDSPSGTEGIKTGLNVKISGVEESRSDGKINSKNLSLPTSNIRTRSPIPEALNRNLNHPDKARVSMEPRHSKSPSSATLLTGSAATHLASSRPGFDSCTQSPTSISIAGSKVHSSTVDRKTPSNPFQPVIVKHEFQPTDAGKGIQQEVNTPGFIQSDSKVPFRSLLAITSGEQSKPNVESKGSFGLNESSDSRKSPLPGQGTEDHEKSYKSTARGLSRPHPALISRNSNALPPSLPVGVAHPYPRASDGGSASNRLKASEHKTSATVSSVTSVTYSSTSPRPLPSAVDVSTELPQPENKAKQLQTLQVPIPVGEVSPVSLKRSPGPAIHSGLPSVLPMLGPGIKTQGSVSSHPSIRSGIKAPGMNEPIRSERKSETLLREPSPYATSKSPVPRPLAMPKPSPEGKSPQQLAPSTASYQTARASDDSSREDSEILIVKEEPPTYGPSKEKPVAEKERERRDIRDAAGELSYGSQEPMSAEQLRNLQYQQQLTLQQYYQPFMPAGGMSLEMMKSLSQLAYMQGMPVDPKATFAAQAQLFQNMQPEQQMQLMQLHRQMMLEQEKKEMRSSSSSSHLEARNFEKKETPKPSDRVQEDRRMEDSGIKKSPQGRAHQDESDFRRFPSQSESLQYASSRGSSPKVMQHKLSPEEPPEKKSRVDDAYERERELERLKYKREEEYLQKQKQLQQMSMLKQLENDLQNKQMGGSFPRKRQTTPEKSERHGNSRDEERVENRTGSARDLIYPRSQESSTSTVKSTHRSFEAENSQGSPCGHVVKSQSLSAPRSPRPSRSPVPTSRYKENSSAASGEKRDGSNPANFMPTQFQAYLSQLNFDPSAGQLPFIGPQFSVPPGLVMSMPITSHGESSSTVTSMASASRDREARSPYRNTERDRNTTPTSHSNSQSRTSTSESHERLQRLKDSAEKETRHSPVMYQGERARNRSTASEQNISPKSSSRTLDFKGEDSAMHSHPSIISNNLAISRMAGHMDVLTEEEIIRRQRFAAEYGDPSQALRMGYYVPPGLIGQLDPAYAASMMQSSQHIGRGMERYMTKRQ